MIIDNGWEVLAVNSVHHLDRWLFEALKILYRIFRGLPRFFYPELRMRPEGGPIEDRTPDYFSSSGGRVEKKISP